MSDEPTENVHEQTEVPATEASTLTPPAEKPKKKVADRPHWITITIGILSPSLAVVGLIFSLISLRTSRDSLKFSQHSLEVAQRAYIHAELVPSVKNESVFFVFTATFKNQGSTPGVLKTLNVKAVDDTGACSGEVLDIYRWWELVVMAQGREIDSHSDENKARYESILKQCPLPNNGPPVHFEEMSIAGKDLSFKEVGLAQDPRMDLQEQRPQVVFPTIIAEFTYEDVFHQLHHGRTVCSVEFIHTNFELQCHSSGD